MTVKFKAQTLLFTISSLVTSSVLSAAPDFSICEGITGVANGLCRAGIAVGCDQQTSQACQNIEDQYMAQTGNPPPWAMITERIVFLTSQTYQPGTDFQGVAGADSICQSLASAAGLDGSYQAWLSDNTGASPSSRFLVQSDVPYVRTDGTIVANDWSDLVDGSILNEIIVDENGNPYLTTTENVWTATTKFGGSNSPRFCNDWTSSSPDLLGNIGWASSGGTTLQGLWTDSVSLDCSGGINGARLYCFQQ